MKTKLTAKTQALMGIKKDESNEDKLALQSRMDFFNNTIDYLVGSISGGVNIAQIEPDGLSAVSKYLKASQRYEPYSEMPEFAAAAKAVEEAVAKLQEAKNALWDAAKELDIQIG